MNDKLIVLSKPGPCIYRTLVQKTKKIFYFHLEKNHKNISITLKFQNTNDFFNFKIQI